MESKRKHLVMFSVSIPNRVYYFYTDNIDYMNEWIDKIDDSIDKITNGEYLKSKSRKIIKISKEKILNNETEKYPTYWVNTPQLFLEELKKAHHFIPFLDEDSASRPNQFLNVWFESIPLNYEISKMESILAVSSNLMKLQWSVYGPQHYFIQKMVDFFWNVGVTQEQLDILNGIGERINPVIIGQWIGLSHIHGMDGGWYFPGDSNTSNITLEDALNTAEPGMAVTVLEQFIKKHNITIITNVGRDMGAAPPNQTEILCELPGNLEKQIEIALDAFEMFEIPSMPGKIIDILKNYSNPGLSLSVITSSAGLARIGILVPSPSVEYVDKLCEIMASSYEDIHEFEKQISCKPRFVEYQYLCQGFGYCAYNEGLDIVFHYPLCAYKYDNNVIEEKKKIIDCATPFVLS